MLSSNDFQKKQIVFVLYNEGDKIAFSNDNLIVKKEDGKVSFQSTCYRLFIVYIVGNCSLTSVIIQKAKKFGFFLVLLTQTYRVYGIIGAEKDGNTLLRRKQYAYSGLEIARNITANKISNQRDVLMSVRNKNELISEAVVKLAEYRDKAIQTETLNELMAYEGLASKLYFRNHFNNVEWKGRQPRVKRDMVNAVLDIGYTLLFNFVDSILCCFGFDTYCGVMHRQFYMRKSLVCDIIEPFRPLIDMAVKKAVNLKQIQENDFDIINGQYRLKWDENPSYISFLMKPILDNRYDIFMYIQQYYRAFMKEETFDKYPIFKIKD